MECGQYKVNNQHLIQDQLRLNLQFYIFWDISTFNKLYLFHLFIAIKLT